MCIPIHSRKRPGGMRRFSTFHFVVVLSCFYTRGSRRKTVKKKILTIPPYTKKKLKKEERVSDTDEHLNVNRVRKAQYAMILQDAVYALGWSRERVR